MSLMYEDLPRLHQAVVRGSMQEVLALVMSGLDPNEVDIGGNQAILHAVRCSDSDSSATALVKVLLMGGARADPPPGNSGPSALGIAVIQGLRECTLSLIEGGADPNYVIPDDRKRDGGDRCLHLLTRDTPAAIIRMLLDGKADVHAVNAAGRTSLHLAAMLGNSAVARVLLEGGAHPAPPCFEGATPLHCAAEKGQYEVAEMLIRAGAPPGFVKQPNGTTPLHMAAQMNNVSVIRLLLREGAPVDALNRSWCTPLMTAAAHAHASAAAVLVSAGASTNQRNALGMAALESVAVSQSRGSPAEVKAFLTALFRSPGSNMRARPWRWPAKSGGRRAAAALATLKKRQQQRQQALAGGETGAGNREDVVDGGGGHATVDVEEGLERRERRGGGAGMPRKDNFLGQSAKSTREGVDGMVGRWRVERHGSDRRRLRALLGSTTRYATKKEIDCETLVF